MPEIRNICAVLCGLQGDLEVAESLFMRVLGLADKFPCKTGAVILNLNEALTQSIVELATSLGIEDIWCLESKFDAVKMQRHERIDVLASSFSSLRIAHDNCLFLMNASSDEEEIAAGVAVRMNALPLGRCEQIIVEDDHKLSIVKSAFGGRMKIRRSLTAGSFFAAVRGVDQPKISMVSKTSTVTKIEVSPAQQRPRFSITLAPKSERHPSIEGARVLVSGGRGIGSEAGFESLYSLAEVLGGAVSASLPAVDAGWAPVARQVGQSGKYVRPDIYLAIAMSGTPQHMAGIDPHKQIIAINSDPEAPIFKQAQIGVVGDWSRIVFALEARLQSLDA
jgi:electron transfer flavoprotein alpha subunit